MCKYFYKYGNDVGSRYREDEIYQDNQRLLLSRNWSITSDSLHLLELKRRDYANKDDIKKIIITNPKKFDFIWDVFQVFCCQSYDCIEEHDQQRALRSEYPYWDFSDWRIIKETMSKMPQDLHNRCCWLSNLFKLVDDNPNHSFVQVWEKRHRYEPPPFKSLLHKQLSD